jgi:hypothetical protein
MSYCLQDAKFLRSKLIFNTTVKPGYKNTIGTREYILIKEVILILKTHVKSKKIRTDE